ncbi:SAM-dependent methyltransferase [Halobacterium jilantaiense]|uniref:tRNA-Thr(GGU) m(6)t(6)A37 methyltransferase TsaA n=1 Tax=Halobacterium jilantaiense TaxID=355548 RepID=A0A1I0MNS0_9EURY|nr:TrmO family methyltransferase [Halobacterium jilantaiense]SEV90182.1 tRNA-Thr(GGU) m(6)t(6)A37 methyltransferase TsaA [Halobacterium jilantaiense]
MSADVVPIGRVETPFETTSEAPPQGEETAYCGNVRVDEQFRDGIGEFAHGDSVVVVWWADRADRDVLRVRDGERGVFSTRSPARPNPICFTECEVVAVDTDDGTLAVRGVDMADGSPVLDLKPPLD